MYKNLFQICMLIFFISVSSCNHERQVLNEGDKINSPLLRQIVTISKIPTINISVKISSQPKPSTYCNTTPINDYSFVPIAKTEISEITKKDRKIIAFDMASSTIVKELNPAGFRKTKWQLSITFDNDIFANRDYYFTNGFRINLIAPFLNSSPLNHILIGTKEKFIEQSGFTLVQNMYTPTNPDTAVVLIGDRPFSAYLLIGQFRETYNLKKKIYIKSELKIGVLGPSAYGNEVQSSIHEKEPVGWVNQIENDLILSYSFKIDKGLVSSPVFEFNLSGRTTLGTLYNKAGGGCNLRLGNFVPVYQGPFSVFQNKNPGGRYQFWIFAEAMIDFIGFDATLQGGMFNKNSVYVVNAGNINRAVFEAGLGFALYYNNIGIEYKHYYLTPEFEGAYSFSWGQIKAVYAF